MLNKAVTGLNSPPVSTVLNWKSSYSGGSGPLIDMSQAVPGYPAHESVLSALGSAAANPDLARYGPVEGEPAFRSAYAQHVSKFYDTSINPDEVQITSGCNQAFVAGVLAVAGEGDNILITRPCYFNHESALNMLGIKIKYIDCDKSNNLLPHSRAIEKAITNKTKAISLVTPNNPTGSIYPPQLLNSIYQLCEKNGLWLIVDETYRDFLPMKSTPPHSLFRHSNWQENLIQLYSFSKSYCLPGHRLGAVIAGSGVVKELSKIIDNIQICAPRFVQHALTPMFETLETWREQNRKIIQHRAKTFRNTIIKLKKWKLLSHGAYFGYVRHPFKDVGSQLVAEAMIKKSGVLVIPGTFFGDGQEQALRFAFANADQCAIKDLYERLENLEI